MFEWYKSSASSLETESSSTSEEAMDMDQRGKGGEERGEVVDEPVCKRLRGGDMDWFAAAPFCGGDIRGLDTVVKREDSVDGRSEARADSDSLSDGGNQASKLEMMEM